VQRGVQLVQILTRHTITGDAGRGLRGPSSLPSPVRRR
jgi:hypothetical protein